MKVVESVFVITLFFLYLVQWKVKAEIQMKQTGLNPKVMSKSTTSVQQYMNAIERILTFYALIIIILHSVGIQYASLFSRYNELSNRVFDVTGFIIGLLGLSICLYAQFKMGSSWRVGIDEKVKTELVTTGLYRFIRNPTYLGLFILNIGVWLIWPTWAMFILNFLFVLFLEFQVRCEEDFLFVMHGGKYEEYKRNTKRYIPFIY